MLPPGLWQPLGWTPQVLASPRGPGPPLGCSSSFPGVCEGPGTGAAPPDSATSPAAAWGLPGPSPELSPSWSSTPSPGAWLMSRRIAGAAGPPQAASQDSWVEEALLGSSWLVLPAWQGPWSPEKDVRAGEAPGPSKVATVCLRQARDGQGWVLMAA